MKRTVTVFIKKVLMPTISHRKKKEIIENRKREKRKKARERKIEN